MTHEAFDLVHISELAAQTETVIEWVVRGIVPRGGITFMVAVAGSGKSLLAYDMAACVLTGEPWLGNIPVAQGGVAYIDLDGKPVTARQRAFAALRGHGIRPEEANRLPFFLSARYSVYDLRDAEARDALMDRLAAVPEIALVVFDTYADLHRGEESSPDDMLDTMHALTQIATQLNTGVLVIHHPRKRGDGTGTGLEDVRGSSAIIGKADAVFILKQERDEEGRPSRSILLQRKARLTAEAEPRTLRMEAVKDADDNLIEYRFIATDEPVAFSGPQGGRPATVMAQAMGLATRILAETPEMARSELARRLLDRGVKRNTAYRVAEQITRVRLSQNPEQGVLGFGTNAEEQDRDGIHDERDDEPHEGEEVC